MPELRPDVAAQAPSLDWDQVRLFLAIARGGSLGAAASRLGLDVSTVSRRLDRLEADLGVHLFDRTRDGTTVTAAAEPLLPHAEEMEQGLLRLAAAVAQVETDIEGVVRLTVPPGVADAFVAPTLIALHRRHPRLRIEIDASIGYADLSRNEADLALRGMRPQSGDLVMTRVITTRSTPLTSPAYAAELGRLRRLEDARWIAWGPELAHLPSARWVVAHGPGVVPVLRTNHFASQLAAARTGLGVMLAAPGFGRFGLVPVTPARSLAAAWKALPGEELWLVGHRALRHVPRIAAVWDFIIEQMAALAADA